MHSAEKLYMPMRATLCQASQTRKWPSTVEENAKEGNSLES